MARVFSAKKSKAGKEIKCGRCSVVIKPGEKYYYFSVGFRGSKQYRCQNHSPRQSETTGNKMSGAYAANESLEEFLNGPTCVSDIASALETAAGEIEQVRDEYQESYDSLPENFQNGEQGSEIQEKIDALTEYADSLSSAASDVASLEDHSGEEDYDADADTDLEAAIEKASDVLQEFSL